MNTYVLYLSFLVARLNQPIVIYQIPSEQCELLDIPPFNQKLRSLYGKMLLIIQWLHNQAKTCSKTHLCVPCGLCGALFY